MKRIGLIGEYSGFHNNLKQGLEALGYKVLIIGTGDGFKNYPVDIKIDSLIFKRFFILLKIKNLIYRSTKIDLASIEVKYRFKKILKSIPDFHTIQLINSICFLSEPSVERFILEKLFKKTKNSFLHGGGNEVPWVDHMLNKNQDGFSSITPYVNDKSLKKHFVSPIKYTTEKYIKHFNFVFSHLKGIIPSDIDYEIVYNGKEKSLPMIPCPLNIENIKYLPLNIEDRINIFCGINTSNRYAKGIPYFLRALDIIREKYPNRVNIKITKDLPHKEYLKIYNETHIFLDQCLSYDQGYNGREAMAKGKVVFSGANKDFKKYYNLTEETMPLVEARPDVDYLVEKLSDLIENSSKLEEISIRARKFIETHHNHIEVAKKYLKAWGVE